MSIFGPAEDLADDKPLQASQEKEPEVEALGSSTSDAGSTADQDLADEEGEDLEGEEIERERFAGKPFKWRRLTRLDRQIVRAQDAIDDEDLSIHLYNAHALKSPVRKSASSLSGLKSWNSKERWRNQKEWVPNKLWTAWPVEDSTMEQLGSRDGPLSMGQSQPYDELEQLIGAAIMNESHKQFNSYFKHQRPDIEDAEDQSSSKNSKVSTKSELADEVNLNPLFGASQTPLPLADDEKAWVLIYPAVRRTVASLETLLKLLHKARQNRYGGKADIGGETSESESGASRGRHTQSRGRSRSVRSVSASRARSKSETRSTERRRRLRTRDWSEILGSAAQSGWDAHVVERAAARCSELFSEEMSFRYQTDSKQHIPIHVPSDIEKKANGPDMLCPIAGCDSQYVSQNGLRRHVQFTHGLIISWPDIEGDIAYTYKEGEDVDGESSIRHLIQRQTNISPRILSDGTHLDGFMQPIVAGRDWGVM